ncbi:hypothetical protein HA466_0105980 [Hirschfeldia incana]|nr:hypothetical protein HA466_0105980 [Hirschfeldia incana]
MASLGSSPVAKPSIDPGGPSPSKISERKKQLRNRDLEMKLQFPSIPAAVPAARLPSYSARDGTLVVQAPKSVLLKTSELWKDHVVTHFHGRRPSAEKIVADLNPVWGKFGRITVRTVSDTCVLIYIPSVQTREWVLQVGYWQADHCAFSVFPWSADGNLAAQELLFAPTWVVLKDVPPQLYSLDGISVVASGVGDPLHTKKSRLDPFHFGDTKVKVEIDLSKALPSAVEVRDTQGNAVRVYVEYPSLPPKCIKCGKFGHLINRCHKPILRKTQEQKQKKEKQENLVSVVKANEDVSLAIPSELEDMVDQEETSHEFKARARSGSRQRSRSRARARKRALSSPSETSEKFEVNSVDEKGAQHINCLQQSETLVGMQEMVKVAESNQGLSIPKEVEDNLEEGEICTETNIQGSIENGVDQRGVDKRGEDESIWFTKQSKNYRRALRQMTLWEPRGQWDPPPKSSKYLTAGRPPE